MRRTPGWTIIVALILLPGASRAADPDARPAVAVRPGADGKLHYSAGERGDRIIDFSAAGYEAGGVLIPVVPVKIVVAPDGMRDRENIQAAIDLVSALPRDVSGFRGAVLLQPGRYAIDGQLVIAASGVVLRGSGANHDGTVLTATGTSRRTLIQLAGAGERIDEAGSRSPITDAYVPAGATRVTVENIAGFAVGQNVVVRRPSTTEWIAQLGMASFPGWRADGRLHWQPGSRDIVWERVITAIEGNSLTFDAPLTTALDQQFGGGTVARYTFPGRIDHVGVENLRCVSETDERNPLDEEHAWIAVALDRVEHAWVRHVTAEHFVSSVVHVQSDARHVTIEACSALAPVSEPANLRRRVFAIDGQLTLVQRCTSESGIRDFTTGFTAAGPNVFLECTARGALDWSGPVESWASGVLYDNVIIRGNALRLLNVGVDNQGAGWAAANSVLWNCEATEIQVQSPPGAPNHAFGCKGDIVDDSLAYDPARMPARDLVRGSAQPPASLYRAQLVERNGTSATAAIARTVIPASSSGARALAPHEVDAFVAAETVRRNVNARGTHPLRVANARFMIDGAPAWNRTQNYSWYQGQMPRDIARRYGPAITRFAPGAPGPGLTDDLATVAEALGPGGVFYQHYGLWYERQRVNHNFYGSPEHRRGNVWGPFMEQPWARSGVGTDWNGMSKYDLTRFNPWYFARVKEFADLCDATGRILYFHFYFQHALQETRAHYVDFPWRPVNCLQATDLPDENPAGSTFYDITHPVRRELHRLYLRHCLDVLGRNTNVVFGFDREYSGPLSFIQFCLDVIAEWKTENQRDVFLCLEIPRDQMDAVLADPIRAPLITAIDFHHWFYRPDGSLFTIVGGINRAPREQQVGVVAASDLEALRVRVTNPTYAGGNIVNAPEFQRLTQSIRNGSPAMRYRAWREYRDAHPHLVIVRKTDEFPALTAAIEKLIPEDVRARTRPTDIVRDHHDSAWVMAAPGNAYVLYTMAGEGVTLDLTNDVANFSVCWLDSAAGEFAPVPSTIAGGKTTVLAPPAMDTKRPWVAWLSATR